MVWTSGERSLGVRMLGQGTFKGVVCDLDGMLVDSEPLWERADRSVVDAYGRTWDESLADRLLGIGLEDATAVLAEHLGIRAHERLTRERLAAFRAELERGVRPRPGARELLQQAAELAVPVAVATNASRSLATTAIDAAGLSDLLDRAMVTTADEVPAPKPAPCVYLLACERLALDPRDVVAFDDSPPGVTAAVDAGLWTVGCPSAPEADLQHAHMVIESLADLDLSSLVGAQVGRPSG